MSDDRKLPDWISEFIPRDLVDSKLFRFNVELQTVRHFVCKDCGEIYNRDIDKCTKVDDGVMCGCTKLERKFKKVTIDLVPDLDLDYQIIEDQMRDLPAQYAFYSMVYSEARLKVSVEERRFKALKGTLIQKVQKSASDAGVRLTVDQVKSIVESEKEIEIADSRLQLAHLQCGKLYHMLEALKMKADLARSLFGVKKKEQDHS